MVTRVILCLSSIAIVLLAASCGKPDRNTENLQVKFTREGNPVAIHLSLSSTDVEPGVEVRLNELVFASFNKNVLACHHRVIRIADYDPKKEALVNREMGQFSSAQVTIVFDGLPPSVRSSHGMALESSYPLCKGLGFKFVARQLGIFLVYADWELAGRDGQLTSKPTILTVRPPLDASGRPILRTEWLADQ